MYKKLIGIVVVGLSLMLSQAALADQSVCRTGLKQMVQSLKLDDVQQSKINPMLDQLQTTMKTSWSQLMDLKAKIHQQVLSSSMDQSAVNDLVDQKTKIIGDMMKARVTAKNQIYNLLNDGQKATLKTMMDQEDKRMEDQYKSCHDAD